jgi:hypothetical protein
VKVRLAAFQRPRGQPLLFFAMVLGGWLVLRVLLWEAPFAGLAPARVVGANLPPPQTAMRRAPAVHPAAAKPARYGRTDEPPARHFAATRALAGLARRTQPQSHLAAAPPENPTVPAHDTADCRACRQDAAEGIFLAEPTQADQCQSADRFARSSPGVPRWSGDAWLFLRRDSAAPLVAGRPAYGRSQAGAVLRYRLAPASGHRPVLYARATRALAGTREGELAAGFAARPLPGLPVSLSAEARVHDSVAGSEVRPAAFAVTELPPARLPLGFRAELYAQAGYVGGRFATAFADGQVRVDRQVVPIGENAELRVGGALSGGAQKHAERLDVGPSAVVSFRLGEANSRLALDYRFRVAGDAEPRSGPALTFSAGF